VKAFADLYRALDETTKTNEKVEALVGYFKAVSPAESAWAVYFLIGRKPRQLVPTRLLCSWAIELGGIPEWLFSESYDAVGDLAETMALLLPPLPLSDDRPLDVWVEEVLLPLRDMDEAHQHQVIADAWRVLGPRQAFVWNKLLTGGFRVGVSQRLVIRALAEVAGIDAAVVAHRLMGDWEPTAEFYSRLVAAERGDADVSQPYPFFLAHPLEGSPNELGEIGAWQAEWKWDGIRAQLIRRAGRTFLWSRGEELVTDRYPELKNAGDLLPEGTVVDGEILPFRNGQVLPFAQLQRRIGRKTLSRKLLDEIPVVLIVFDLLEHAAADVRSQPLAWRRQELSKTVAAVAERSGALQLSPMVSATSWEELATQRAESRQRHVEGLMLKRLDSPYRVGRVRGDWWKWKIEPYAVDAVLIYAQPGNGKRAGLFTDYTFGLWDAGELLPVAKAYSGLTDEEIRQVDAFVRRNTLEKFGPVRRVRPELVFELGFEAIAASTRHRSGVAVRFPRMLRWRHDKKAEEADTLESLKRLLPVVAAPRTTDGDDEALPLFGPG
jgi:DNA ligase-1